MACLKGLSFGINYSLWYCMEVSSEASNPLFREIMKCFMVNNRLEDDFKGVGLELSVWNGLRMTQLLCGEILFWKSRKLKPEITEIHKGNFNFEFHFHIAGFNNLKQKHLWVGSEEPVFKVELLFLVFFMKFTKNKAIFNELSCRLKQENFHL